MGKQTDVPSATQSLPPDIYRHGTNKTTRCVAVSLMRAHAPVPQSPQMHPFPVKQRLTARPPADDDDDEDTSSSAASAPVSPRLSAPRRPRFDDEEEDNDDDVRATPMIAHESVSPT